MTGIVTKMDTNTTMQSVLTTNDLATGASTSSGLSLTDIQTALQGMSIGTGAIEFIIKFIDDIYSVVNNSGVQIILMLASLQSISPSVYEAASIEGATGWESFWKITLPMVAPVVFVCAIYTVIDQMSASTNSIMLLIVKTTENSGYGLASAMAWIFLLVNAVILFLVTLIGRKAAFK
jgi:ABC-type sugar transport system permease subunit